ncbi:MAG: hypothetical protein M3362_09985 [Acidobacteriota bacterium]|nr:hypothetical protein [Acidobacteriota bacterium]
MNAPYPHTAADSVLKGLKDFQRKTVDYVFRRLYLDNPPAGRFLVADEVGLGKTLVARGVIAKVIEHLRNKDKDLRIDIVYICSNADIARQNINRLNVTGGEDFELASRITLLPILLHGLKQKSLNFISFTPGTSFDLKKSLGIAQERALLYWLLKKSWAITGAGPLNVLQGDSGTERFRRLVNSFNDNHQIDEALTDDFAQALKRHIAAAKENGELDIYTRFSELCQRFKRTRIHIPSIDRHDRALIVGELRALLAATCLVALQPDLIILDEFQRFKHLLDGTDKASDLARDLFEYPEARVLLLSATPYKMYTITDEENTEDHYKDFLRTLQFLKNDASRATEFEQLLDEYRRELFRLGNGTDSRLALIKDSLERELRRVMVRTEKLAVSQDRDGMLREFPSTATKLESKDLNAYLSLQKTARLLGEADTLEYWKSSPYLLNFMDDYKFKSSFTEALRISERETELAETISDDDGLLLNWRDITRYRRVDPGNARLRGLLDDTIGVGAWRLLWMPPSLPYYSLDGPFAQVSPILFTKRLVFSSWKVVPKVISLLLSYEAERLIMRSLDESPENTPEARKRRSPLLRFAQTDGRLTGMPVLGLLYPCITLARECDPLRIAIENREAGETPVSSEVVEKVRSRIEQLLAKLTLKGTRGPEDEAWYWAAPILLDLQFDKKATREWLMQIGLAEVWSGESGTEEEDGERSHWSEHVDYARKLIGGHLRLGRQPNDLALILAQMALSAPGTTALRALSRVTGGLKTAISPEIRTSAAQVGWSFRRLFNLPEAIALLRGMNKSEKPEKPYWRQVVEYCVSGCLQSTLDEYAHILRESLGLLDQSIEDTASKISKAMQEALSLRTSTVAVDNIKVNPSRNKIKIERLRRLRSHFAMRFGEEKNDETQEVTRAEQVREAFNSPFWPFVLATTSVGQEGLDFHHYCHAVVHWNLPSNPVDLEQREGRVHRYKGHAVRKNLVLKYQSAGLPDVLNDPWEELFVAGKKDRAAGTSDLVPFWVFPLEGGAHIERHVPALPLSRDRERFEILRRSLAVYRMVFGQSRQEDLTAYLLAQLPESEVGRVSEELRINLEPPPVS